MREYSPAGPGMFIRDMEHQLDSRCSRLWQRTLNLPLAVREQLYREEDHRLQRFLKRCEKRPDIARMTVAGWGDIIGISPSTGGSAGWYKSYQALSCFGFESLSRQISAAEKRLNDFLAEHEKAAT